MNYFRIPERSRCSAFTLIEISIVLVIIGLLIGGVLAGRVMLRQSDLASVVTDAHKYIGAAEAFKQKYNALPGDMATATDYWGAAGGSAPYTDSCYASTATDTATCNGNGNGRVGENIVSLTRNEMLRVWQHLGNAGFIKGSFTGISTYDHIPGTNCPASGVNGGGFALRYIGVFNDINDFMFAGNYGHVLFFSALKLMPMTGSKTGKFDWTLRGDEAQALDAKFDDGLPVSGSMRTWKNFSSSSKCATSANSSATYDISTNNLVCSLLFITGF